MLCDCYLHNISIHLRMYICLIIDFGKAQIQQSRVNLMSNQVVRIWNLIWYYTTRCNTLRIRSKYCWHCSLLSSWKLCAMYWFEDTVMVQWMFANQCLLFLSAMFSVWNSTLWTLDIDSAEQSDSKTHTQLLFGDILLFCLIWRKENRWIFFWAKVIITHMVLQQGVKLFANDRNCHFS